MRTKCRRGIKEIKIRRKWREIMTREGKKGERGKMTEKEMKRREENGKERNTR